MDHELNVYESLMKDMKDLRDAQATDDCGMDEFLSPDDKRKVASLGDLADFFRVSTDTLVHKAKKDFWRISEDEKGNCVIERLVNDKKKPIPV